MGCGKSTVARILAELGASVLDADEVVHRLYAPGGRGAAALTASQGAGVLDASGGVDRAALGKRLFSDPGLKRQVEETIHPLVKGEIAAWLASVPAGTLAVCEIPLLYETGLESDLSPIVVVACSPEAQRARLAARHPDWTRAEMEARIAAQMVLAEKVRRADHVVWNDGDLSTLRSSCETLFATLRAAASGRCA